MAAKREVKAYWRARGKSEDMYHREPSAEQETPLLQRARGFTDGWKAAIRWARRQRRSQP